MLVANANTLVTRDRLAEALWAEPPRSARQQLYNAVNGLRRLLAPATPHATLLTAATGYQFQAATDLIDVFCFDKLTRRAEEALRRGAPDQARKLLEQALAHWRGPALEGVRGRHLTRIAEQLTERRLAAVEQLFTIRVHAGEQGPLIDDLIRLVAEHPYREILRATLMEALYRNGRQTDALAVFEQGRTLLAENYGMDPGPALHDLHLRILRNEMADELTAAPDAEPVAPTDEPETRNNFLPHDTPGFTGRDSELAVLTEATASAMVICIVNGMGGVGKTATAVHLAHRLTSRYPDGQYYLDLQGFTPQRDPLTSSQALDHLLRQAGVPAGEIPSDEERRSALWRSHLTGRRALLLLDNAAGTTQVRPLLPGAADMLVVVTSRRRLTALDRTATLSLDVLSPSSGARLFTRIAGEARVQGFAAEVGTVVELCGRLPLAIRVAAARFRDHRTWPIGHLISRLSDSGSRGRLLAVGDRDVMTVLAASYHRLDHKTQRVFRLLSLSSDADFDAHTVSSLAGVSLDCGERALDSLYDANLLTQHGVDRFGMHGLVRDCARALLTAEAEQLLWSTASS
ncbi:BTAD domain-containing putative transcriptional regulator [Actinoplanes sp. CA-015351]|uniref:AfsR/SARP family transcriptional regulator n=1 Tax=Actinoplanes sp. CA-015351 TaxID=3239897 RepID=UPI003D99C39E